MSMSKTRKIIFAILLSTALISGTCLALALNSIFYNMPMTGTVLPKISLKFYVNGTEWFNNTAVAWGNLSATNIAYLDINNTSNVAVIVTGATSGLPEDWELAFPQSGSSIAINEILNCTLTLTVPTKALAGNYTWNFTINT